MTSPEPQIGGRTARAAVAIAFLGLVASALTILIPISEPLRLSSEAPWLREVGRALGLPARLELAGETLALARRTLALAVLLLTAWLFWIRLRVHQLQASLSASTELLEEGRAEREELQERYRSFVDEAEGFLYRHDLNGRSLWLDDEGLGLFGYTRDALRRLSIRDLIAPEHVEGIQAQMEEAVRGGTASRRQEFLALTARGRPLWIESRSRLLREEGAVVGVEGVGRDCTARKLSAVEEALEVGISRLLTEQTSLEGALREALHLLCGELGWTAGQAWWVDETYRMLRLGTAWPLETAELPVSTPLLAKGVGLPGRAWARSETLMAEDCSREEAAWTATLPGDAPRSAAAIPLRVTGRVIGVAVLVGHVRSDLVWPPPEVLESVGESLGAFVERKRSEATLEGSEARTRAVLESALDAIVTVDSEGRVLEFNPAAETIFGVPRDEALGSSVDRLLIPEDLRDTHRRAFARRLEEGGRPLDGGRIEVEALHADGTRIPVEMAIACIRTGERPIFTATLRDIAERKEVERLKDELVSTVSHELRTPLASLRGFVELMLAREYSPEERHQFLEILDREIRRLSKLIDDFLDLQRLEAGVLDYSMEACDLRELAAEATSVVRAASGRHEYRVELGEEPLPVEVDVDRMRQVLMNLLSNAVKYSPEGGAVSLRAGALGTRVWLSVRDQGIGMDAETVGRLFRKFYRADSALTRQIGGTGLGLSLVKQIVEAHGGEVEVESTPEAGSEFRVLLPRAPCEAREDPGIEGASA